MSFDSASFTKLIQRRRSGDTLEQPFYTDPTIFAIDLDRDIENAKSYNL